MVRAGDGWRVSVPADWMQGRSVFGGLQAALLLRAMRGETPDLPLRVFQTTFIAPMLEGESRICARVLRSGKTTVHAEARVLVGSETAAIAIGVFGASRASEIAVRPAPRPIPAVRPRDLGPVTKELPAFLQHFGMRWFRGGPPGTGMTEPESILEVDLRDEGAASEEHVLAIADATPPIALSMLKRFVPGSSLTWTVEMVHGGSLATLGLAGWRLDVELVAAASGYTSQSEIVWGPDGQAAAISRQCMVVFG